MPDSVGLSATFEKALDVTETDNNEDWEKNNFSYYAYELKFNRH